MKNLSFIEFAALLFTGIAGMASAVQAYVSWEMRGEVSRAIVFAERIDACAKAMAAIEPFVAKAREEGRTIVAGGAPNGRYSLPQYYYRLSSGNAAFRAQHSPRVKTWRTASAALLIVSPKGAEPLVAKIDEAVTKDIPAGKYMSQAEMVSWLEQLETTSLKLRQNCRDLV